MDGVGEWATTSTGIGRESELVLTKEIHFPHSLGLLYSAFTHYTGFKVNSGEYKVMGLAPYGEPRFAQTILDNLIDLKPDGSFRLNIEFFEYCTGLAMTNGRFDSLFGGPARGPEELLTQRHMDLAASIQTVTDEIVLRLARSLAAETGMKNLCLAGGVALNRVANGKVLSDGCFQNIWIQPAAGDAGGTIGAAPTINTRLYRDPTPMGAMQCKAPIWGRPIRRLKSKADWRPRAHNSTCSMKPTLSRRRRRRLPPKRRSVGSKGAWGLVRAPSVHARSSAILGPRLYRKCSISR
jgi:predicted NodU family carbamoyl transferase